MELFDLAEKVAIVTGGGGGIGLGMAHGLGRAGAALALVDRNEEKLARAVGELEEAGFKAIGVPADVTSGKEVEKMVGEVAAKLGRVDILFNNAGISSAGINKNGGGGVSPEPQSFPEEDWHAVLNTNLTSAFLCSKAVYPEFKKAGGGKVVNTGSIMAFLSLPQAAAYCASKGGIVQLTKALATAWAPDNIQVNAINPGWIDTDMTRHSAQKREGFVERVVARTPQARWGKPEDFQGVAVFLASRASDFITGSAIVVDGGFSSLG